VREPTPIIQRSLAHHIISAAYLALEVVERLGEGLHLGECERQAVVLGMVVLGEAQQVVEHRGVARDAIERQRQEIVDALAADHRIVAQTREPLDERRLLSPATEHHERLGPVGGVVTVALEGRHGLVEQRSDLVRLAWPMLVLHLELTDSIRASEILPARSLSLCLCEESIDGI